MFTQLKCCPLHYAAKLERTAVVETLLKYKANVDCINEVGYNNFRYNIFLFANMYYLYEYVLVP